MTDDKLDAILRQALQPYETPPEIQPAPVKKAGRLKWPGVLAACACLALCVGGYFALSPNFRHFTAATESTVTMETTEAAAPAMGAEQQNTFAAEESYSTADGTMVVCRYPTAADMAAKKWIADNAPNVPYKLLAESERYCSYICIPAEGERLYLVIDKQTMESVPLQELMARGDFSMTVEDVNTLYVNQNQELILVQGTEEICLGPIE